MRLFRHVGRVIIGSTVALSLLSPMALAANLGDRPLSVGSAGDDVTALQQQLQNKGYFTVSPTGYFGNITQQAVLNFQRDTGLTTDGVASTQTISSLSATGQTHVVVAGDTLWDLARHNGTTVEQIKSANGLTSDVIYIGRSLTIPGAKTATAAASTAPTVSSRSDVSRDDIMLIARLIEAEAGGESYQGKLSVGAVIMNRVKSPNFPNTIKGVIYQEYQFEPVLNGFIWNVTPSADSVKAAEQAVSGVDPTGGANFFYNPSKAYSGFLASKPVIYSVGGHVFSR